MSSCTQRWGVLYLVWGDSHEELLQRSIASVKKHHPELPIHLERVPLDISCTASPYEMLLKKAGMLNVTPFENTLFLDADTVVMERLNYAFQKAERFGLACCICECPWARRYAGLKSEQDLIEYNTGVLFFTRTAAPLFYLWERMARQIDSSFHHLINNQLCFMAHNDQASFAKAVDMIQFNPFILPKNWNFRPQWDRSFFGQIKIWHDRLPPLQEMHQINEMYRDKDALVGYFPCNVY